MNIPRSTSPVSTPSHTVSQPGSVSHPPYTLTGANMNRVASQNSSDSMSNYLLMKNLDKNHNASSGSQSFHTINPSLHQSTSHYMPQPNIQTIPQHIDTPPSYNTNAQSPSYNTNPQLQLASNTIKQHIQLPLTYTPVRKADKYSVYRHNDTINEQQEHNYKFEYMQLKSAYQQLKQSHQQLNKDYESIRQKVVIVRNNQQVLVARNDQLVRSNSILSTRVYQLQEELKSMKLGNQQSMANSRNQPAKYLSNTSFINTQQQLQQSNQQQQQASRITIKPLTPTNTFIPLQQQQYVTINQQFEQYLTPNQQLQLPTSTLTLYPNPNPTPTLYPTPNTTLYPTLYLTHNPTPFHPPLLQLQHQNRQLLYRIQQYQSSIIYKNSQIQKLCLQIKDKQVQIMSLRRQVQTYLKRQAIYQQNQQLIQIKNQQLQIINNKIQDIIKQNQQNFRHYNELQSQNSLLRQKNTLLNEQIGQLKLLQMRHKQQQNRHKQQQMRIHQQQMRLSQKQRQNEQFRQTIINLQKVNKQYQIAHNIHQQLLQSMPQQDNMTMPTIMNQHNIPLMNLYEGISNNQDFSKVLTTYIGDQTTTNPNQPSYNQYSKINSTLYNNLKNVTNNLNLSSQTAKQNVAVMRLANQHMYNNQQGNYPHQLNGVNQSDSLAYRLAENLNIQKPTYHHTMSSNPHYQSHIKQHQNHSMSSQIYEGMKSSRHFNKQSSKLNIEDQTYFDFNKQNGQTQPQNKNINMNSNNISLDALPSTNSLKLHYQKLNLLDKLNNQPVDIYQSNNILSFPQLPFTIKPDDIAQHQQKINTVTFADPLSQTLNNYSYQQKPKRHNKIFTQQNIPNTNSLETLQCRIQQLAQQNKNLRQYLVKKSH